MTRNSYLIRFLFLKHHVFLIKTPKVWACFSVTPFFNHKIIVSMRDWVLQLPTNLQFMHCILLWVIVAYQLIKCFASFKPIFSLRSQLMREFRLGCWHEFLVDHGASCVRRCMVPSHFCDLGLWDKIAGVCIQGSANADFVYKQAIICGFPQPPLMSPLASACGLEWESFTGTAICIIFCVISGFVKMRNKISKCVHI